MKKNQSLTDAMCRKFWRLYNQIVILNRSLYITSLPLQWFFTQTKGTSPTRPIISRVMWMINPIQVYTIFVSLEVVGLSILKSSVLHSGCNSVQIYKFSFSLTITESYPSVQTSSSQSCVYHQATKIFSNWKDGNKRLIKSFFYIIYFPDLIWSFHF